MADYKKIVEEALKKANLAKGIKTEKRSINESVLYPDGLTERMHPDLEAELAESKHSLGKHPIFPEGDESSFEQKIMGERFNEVATRYKRAFDCDSIDNGKLLGEMMPLIHDSMALESKHKKELEDLAVRMIREEYNMGEDIVDIHAELTPRISLVGTKKNPKPVTNEIEFNNHDYMVKANKEVYKRRFLNAMTQGAAKKCNHMFHMVDDELTKMEPRLPSKYAKMMSAADYMYYVIPKMENGTTGGVVKVQFPTESNPKAAIYVQAMVFPVLIHELVKGVMELLSAHGLPKDKKTGSYVIDKADFLAAEPWDMRIGPALWGKFIDAIEPDDFELKHHIYSELAALPVDEFNMKMREIMAGTKDGKDIIKGIVKEVRSGLQEDEFNEAMNEIDTYGDEENNTDSDVEGFDFEELMGIGGSDEPNTDSSDEEEDEGGFDFGELF